MPLDITINASAPPSGVAFIEHAATLSQRNAIVAAHTVGTGEKGFTGFTDYTGWTATTVTTADELRTALALNSGVATTKKIITCNWNGMSRFTGSSTIAGPNSTALAAYVNGAKDIGFDTPPHYTKIVAGNGFAPVLGAADGGTSPESLKLRGFGWVEIDGLGFTHDFFMDHDFPTTAPMLAICALKNCAFSGNSVWLIETRVQHVANCVFNGATTLLTAGVQWFRFWDNEIKSHNKLGDFSRVVGYTATYRNTWNPSAWYSGNVFHSFDADTDGANHCDILQCNFGSEVNPSLTLLFEFNLCNSNTPLSQGILGDDSTQNLQMNACIHNNIFAVNSFDAIYLIDPSGTGAIRVYRNTILRAGAKLTDTEVNARIALVDSVSVAQQDVTTGVYDIRENYYNLAPALGTKITAGSTVTGNLVVGNNPGANYVQTLFTGNGTWTTNGFGIRGYTTDPGFGLSKSAAKTAMRNFWAPVAGYRTAGYGCVDPNNWPVAGAAW